MRDNFFKIISFVFERKVFTGIFTLLTSVSAFTDPELGFFFFLCVCLRCRDRINEEGPVVILLVFVPLRVPPAAMWTLPYYRSPRL